MTISFENELMLVKVRYKLPKENDSNLISQAIVDDSTAIENASDNLKFAASVAEFGMILRGSPHGGEASLTQVLELANSSKGKDTQGYRTDFIELVQLVVHHSDFDKQP